MSLQIIRIRAAGYPGPNDSVTGRCVTTLKFPATFTKPGVHLIRYRCADGVRRKPYPSR
jgi:hypothetical protein